MCWMWLIWPDDGELGTKITQALGDAFTVFPVQQNASNTIKKEGSYDV